MDAVDKAYENLANAVVVAACQDYTRLLRGKKVAGEDKASLQRWFGGRWAGVLCGDIDPTDIMRMLERDGAKIYPKECKHKVTINGQTHTLPEWSRLTGISPATLYNRLQAGWGEAEFLSPPSINRKQKGRHGHDATRA